VLQKINFMGNLRVPLFLGGSAVVLDDTSGKPVMLQAKLAKEHEAHPARARILNKVFYLAVDDDL
jgi:hypothetical protein